MLMEEELPARRCCMATGDTDYPSTVMPSIGQQILPKPGVIKPIAPKVLEPMKAENAHVL